MYWCTHQPFSAVDLVERGMTHSVCLTRFCLWRMEQKGQIIIDESISKTRYIGTTESREEWDYLKQEKAMAQGLVHVFMGETCGCNKYELQEMLDTIDEIKSQKISEISARKKGREKDE